MRNAFNLTVLRSAQEEPAGKRFDLNEAGNLIKTTNGTRKVYAAERVAVDGVVSLAELIGRLTPDHYITQGVFDADRVAVVSQGLRLEQERKGVHTTPDGLPIKTFTAPDAPFPTGPGLMVIDADGLSITEAMDALTFSVSGSSRWPVLATTSSGANIYAEDGTELRGQTGCHLLIPVADATDTPRVLRVMHRRAVMNRCGQVKLSAAGSFLVRSFVDLALVNPVQPVFLHSRCGPGLKQRKAFEVFNSDMEPVDTKVAVPDLNEHEVGAFLYLVAQQQRELADEALRVRRQYLEVNADRLVAHAAKEGRVLTPADARHQVAKSMASATLGADVVLHHRTGAVTVREVLADRQRWDGVAIADPLEPSYGSGVGVAKLFLSGTKSLAHSFAHGSKTYRLVGDTVGAEQFDVAAWFSEIKQELYDDIAAVQGDPQRLKELQTPRHTGDTVTLTKLDGTTVEGPTSELAAAAARVLTGAPADEVFPVELDVEVVDDAVLFGIHNGEVFIPLTLPLSAVKGLLVDWLARDADGFVAGWPALVVKACGVDLCRLGLDLLAHDCRVVARCKKEDAQAQLEAAIRDYVAELEAAIVKATPRPTDVQEEHADPAEQALAAARAKLAVEAGMLQRAGDIGTDPLACLYRDVDRLGVVGERACVLVAFLAVLSAALPKPVSAVLRGPPGTGKSHVMHTVSKLFHPQRIYLCSSMSAKAMIYEPRPFAHTTILLMEAEALRRDTGDETNGLAELLRNLLSEGRLVHKVVEKVDDQHTTRTIEVEGPTNLLTTTTRPRLDPELETRLLDYWSDTTPEHARAVLAGIGERAAGVAPPAVDFDAWHSFTEWCHAFKGHVVVPYARVLAELFRQEGSRQYRDLHALLGLISTLALVHRTKRRTDAAGNVFASIDDYRIVYDLMAPRFGEMSGRQVPADLVTLFEAIRDLIADKGEHVMGTGFTPTGKPDAPRWAGKAVRLSIRKMAAELEANRKDKESQPIGKMTIERGLQRLAGLDLLEVRRNPDRPKEPALIGVAADADLVLKGGAPVLPTPDTLAEACRLVGVSID